MAQSAPKSPNAAPSRKPGSSSASRRRRALLLAILGVVGAVIVVAAVWLVWSRTGRQDFGGRLTVSKDFGEKARAGAPAAPGPAGAAGPAEARSHTVRPGENLWNIAGKGDLVGSAWEWRTILVQNRDKIQYAFLSEDDGGWKVIVEDGKELTVKKDASASYPGAAAPPRKLYAVQVLTVPETRLTRAVGIVHQLLADGHFAYLYRREADGQRFYRIRVGFYPSPEDAKQAGAALVAQYQARKLFKDFWVMLPSELELQGGHLDYGAQQARPWVVQLPERGSHREALDDLRKIAAASDFAYIAQKRAGSEEPARYVYRIRIGFFASESQAQDFIAAHKDAADVLGQGAAVKVDTLQEALPGQNLRLGKPAPG